jgi:hypothetical protein
MIHFLHDLHDQQIVPLFLLVAAGVLGSGLIYGKRKTTGGCQFRDM